MVDTSDFILLVAALFIFAIMQINFSGSLIRSTQNQVDTELNYTALALAQDIADESRLKAFDEVRVGYYVPVTSTSDLSTLGTDSEVYPNFDDFDDFHNYTRVDSTRNGVYTSTVTVDYMDPTNLRQVSVNKTYYKRMMVKVASEMGDTVAVSYIRRYY